MPLLGVSRNLQLKYYAPSQLFLQMHSKMLGKNALLFGRVFGPGERLDFELMKPGEFECSSLAQLKRTQPDRSRISKRDTIYWCET